MYGNARCPKWISRIFYQLGTLSPLPSGEKEVSQTPHCMPSYDFDNHTLCITCRGQVCDLDIFCDECRDWPLSKRKVFVNYNRGLKTRREYKKRKARLASAVRSSDQSVYDTDTDVPLDEPSVPVPNVQLESVSSQEYLVSQECVVPEAPPRRWLSRMFYSFRQVMG